MSVVVDASTTVKWVVDERGSDAALALLRDEEELIVPSLWLAEVANALWKIARTGNITTQESATRFAELSDAPVTIVAIEPHMPAALALANELSHAVYDCVYLAVAIFENTQVITDDRRFVASVAGSPHLSSRVRLLGT
jgi:predicted nucleic acid-binding protein